MPELTPRDRILNCTPSLRTERDWRFDHAAAAGLLEARPALPPCADLRASWWEVGDQGSSGSCVGWAAADSVIRWHLVRAGLISPDARLSPRFVWMASKEFDGFVSQPTTMIESAGTALKSALDIARKFGLVEESVLPFDSCRLYVGEVETFYAIASQLKIVSYFNLGRSAYNWRAWIATRGPVLTRLEVDSTWDQATATEGKLDRYDRDSLRGGHAVALVGYTPDRLIVRNSWGAGWGDGGFAYASPAYAEAAFTEAYGVSLADR